MVRQTSCEGMRLRFVDTMTVGAALLFGAVLSVLAGCTAVPQRESTSRPKTNSAEGAETAVADATGAALQGDAQAAVVALAQVPAAAFTGDARAFRDCMLERFGYQTAPALPLGDDSWIASLAQAYVTYWRSVLTRAVPEQTAEVRLATTVGSLIGRPLASAAALDDAEEDIQAAVRRRGYYALLGRTPPLRELMLWRVQDVQQRAVDLPGGREIVTVNLLDDFLLRGWGYYATCGRRSAGGWATDTALFAVVPAYKNRDDEVFSVRFLGHEAQHFADKRAFRGLESWELEYRAKLVELALGTYSQPSTLMLFCENRAASKSSPHGYANARVVREVSARIGIDEAALCGPGTLPEQAIRQQSRALLEEDTTRRIRSRPAPGTR